MGGQIGWLPPSKKPISVTHITKKVPFIRGGGGKGLGLQQATTGSMQFTSLTQHFITEDQIYNWIKKKKTTDENLIWSEMLNIYVKGKSCILRKFGIFLPVLNEYLLVLHLIIPITYCNFLNGQQMKIHAIHFGILLTVRGTDYQICRKIKYCTPCSSVPAQMYWTGALYTRLVRLQTNSSPTLAVLHLPFLMIPQNNIRTRDCCNLRGEEGVVGVRSIQIMVTMTHPKDLLCIM